MGEQRSFSIENLERDPMCNLAAASFVAHAALGFSDPDSAEFRAAVSSGVMSPTYGNLSGLPPMVISAGEAEVLVPSIRTFRDKALEAGVQVQYSERQGMPHVYPIFTGILPEADQEVDGPIKEFVDRVFARQH